MQYDLTAGAQRVFDEAAAWVDSADSNVGFSPQTILVGLLAETECRAALILARFGLNIDVVARRWPTLIRKDTPQSAVTLSPEVTALLDAAGERLEELPRPLSLATEHLLLGLVSTEHETAQWLREQGLDPDALEAEIFQNYGHRPGTLPFEEGGAADSPTSDQVHHLRVMDAAADRAREGVRVVEDYCRFVLDDAHLCGQLKTLRHELTDLLSCLPQEQLLAARETMADVGTRISTSSELVRNSLSEVCAANFVRLQEALRSLEEFAKTLDPDLASRFEQLRYRAYTLHRAVEIGRFASERLAESRLYVLIDGRESMSDFVALAESLVEADVDLLQLRDKRLADRPLLERAHQLREITASSKTRFLMNDRADLALLAKADGVHLGQEEISVKDARTIVGPDRLIGVSAHTIEQARQAVLAGADYLGVGPTFPSRTKSFDAFAGVGLLRTVASEIRLPAFAIGGIDRDNLDEVFSTGIDRIAVSGAILGASDPTVAVRQMRALLEQARK